MKTRLLFPLLAVALLLAPGATAAAPKKAKSPGAEPATHGLPSLSARLTTLVLEMSELLNFNLHPKLAVTEKYESKGEAGRLLERLRLAPPEIAVLRADFAARRVAKPAQAPACEAGIAVCEAMTIALNERREVIANRVQSTEFHTPKNDTTKRGKQEAAQTDKWFDEQAHSLWLKRKSELLQSIDYRYQAFKVAEAAAAAS